MDSIFKEIKELKKIVDSVNAKNSSEVENNSLLKCENIIKIKIKLLKPFIKNSNKNVNVQKQIVSHIAILESLKSATKIKLNKIRAAGAQQRIIGAGLRHRSNIRVPQEKNLLSNRVHWKEVGNHCIKKKRLINVGKYFK